MVNEIRRSLKQLRSGILPELAIDALVEQGRGALRALTQELATQTSSSLFTGTILQVMGRIAESYPKALNATTIQLIMNNVQHFIPRSISGPDRTEWMLGNIELLGTQLRRSRFNLDDRYIKRAETAFRVKYRDDKVGMLELRNVLDGDLDAVAEQKQAYVDTIVLFMEDTIASQDPWLATNLCQILSCFGHLAKGAVPGVTELLKADVESNSGDITRILMHLENLERIGDAARDTTPTVIEALSAGAETLLREDTLVIHVLDTLGAIGETTEQIRRLLIRSSEHPAAIIQERAKGTIWKLCLDEDPSFALNKG